jgi:hypothetical protein
MCIIHICIQNSAPQAWKIAKRKSSMTVPIYSRPITDLYFFEELRHAIGPDASSQWLADEGRKRGIDHSNPTKAVITTVAPLAVGGRDLPKVKIQAPSDYSCCSSANIEDSANADESFLETPNNMSEGREPTAEMRVLLSLFADQNHEIASARFKSNSILEKKLGLLFTDAAHTVLDWMMSLWAKFPQLSKMSVVMVIASRPLLFQRIQMWIVNTEDRQSCF